MGVGGDEQYTETKQMSPSVTPRRPSKVLFVKNKLPDGSIFIPAVTAPSLNMSRLAATKKLLFVVIIIINYKV
jgi:hypothetical protein